MNTDKTPDNRQSAQLAAQLRRLPLQAPPAGLSEAVLARIATRRPGLFRRLGLFFTAPIHLTFRPLSAACLIILVCSVSLFIWPPDRPTPRNHAPIAGDALSSSLLLADAKAAYLIGRGMLELHRHEESLALLQRAAALAPNNPDYALWEGIAHWKNGNLDQERESYLRGLKQAPESSTLLVNLGHHYLSNGRLEEALDTYRTVQSLAPDTAIAWYNSGLIYREMNLVAKEMASWKHYLQTQRFGSQAFRAVERLNAYGDFSYRSYQIGPRTLIIRQEALLSPDATIDDKRQEVAVLADFLEKNERLTLEVATFYAGDLERARRQALAIKKLIAAHSDTPLTGRIKVSWFDVPELFAITGPGGTELAESLLLFGTMTATQNKQEVSI